MKKLIVNIFSTSLALLTTSYLIQGFQVGPSWQAYLLASVIFIILNAFVAPLIKLLLLPINLLTLGLFRWVSNVLVLYIFDVLYTGVTISGYDFGGYTSNIIALPPGHLSLFWTLVLSSLTISLTYGIISSLLHSE